MIFVRRKSDGKFFNNVGVGYRRKVANLWKDKIGDCQPFINERAARQVLTPSAYDYVCECAVRHRWPNHRSCPDYKLRVKQHRMRFNQAYDIIKVNLGDLPNLEQKDLQANAGEVPPRA